MLKLAGISRVWWAGAGILGLGGGAGLCCLSARHMLIETCVRCPSDSPAAVIMVIIHRSVDLFSFLVGGGTKVHIHRMKHTDRYAIGRANEIHIRTLSNSTIYLIPSSLQSLRWFNARQMLIYAMRIAWPDEAVHMDIRTYIVHIMWF